MEYFPRQLLPQICFFRDEGQAPGLANLARDADQPDAGHGILYCRECHAPVTSDPQRISVQGSHCHAQANPDGIVFEIGCFGQAPGCLPQGQPTRQYSWFPPHAWCFALCRNCGTHLGWYYQAVASPSFYGLILNRLVEDSS